MSANSQKIVEIGAQAMRDADNKDGSWQKLTMVQLMEAAYATLKADGFYICRLDDEIIAKSIVTKCVVDELAVQPMPDEVAYALAQAVIETLKGDV